MLRSYSDHSHALLRSLAAAAWVHEATPLRLHGFFPDAAEGTMTVGSTQSTHPCIYVDGVSMLHGTPDQTLVSSWSSMYLPADPKTDGI